MLPLDDFKKLIEISSLFAFDFIVKDEDGRVLLGLRCNSPAEGYWFVPGGRTYKNETLTEALSRISKAELGFEVTKDIINPIGLFEHVYKDSFFPEVDFGTHYIVLAIEVKIPVEKNSLPSFQHSSYKFLNVHDLLNDISVHPFTKSYFIDTPSNLFLKLNKTV